MNGCIYRTKDGECDLYAEGGKYKAFCDMDGCKGRKMSNADRIRVMSDKELAVMFFNYHFSFTCPEQGCHECKESCMDCWLDWLKKEVEE